MLIKKRVLEITGYGLVGLIRLLEFSEWRNCVPRGQNFHGILLGEHVLTIPGDSLCPKKFFVTITSVRSGRTFIVTGFSTTYMPEDAKNRGIEIAGNALRKKKNFPHGIQYRVLIEAEEEAVS